MKNQVLLLAGLIFVDVTLAETNFVNHTSKTCTVSTLKFETEWHSSIKKIYILNSDNLVDSLTNSATNQVREIVNNLLHWKNKDQSINNQTLLEYLDLLKLMITQVLIDATPIYLEQHKDFIIEFLQNDIDQLNIFLRTTKTNHSELNMRLKTVIFLISNLQQWEKLGTTERERVAKQYADVMKYSYEDAIKRTDYNFLEQNHDIIAVLLLYSTTYKKFIVFFWRADRVP